MNFSVAFNLLQINDPLCYSSLMLIDGRRKAKKIANAVDYDNFV
jgi:hypothetical protein